MDPEPLSPRPGSSRARLRFPRAARLTAAGEFSRVREKGRAFHSPRLVLAVLRPSEPPAADAPARFGIITGRRVGRAASEAARAGDWERLAAKARLLGDPLPGAQPTPPT